MTRRRIKNNEPAAEFELLFSAIGSVSLIEIDGDEEVTLWSSDDDEDFAEEFDGDFFDATDADEIIEYLEEIGLVEDDSEIDIVEEDAKPNPDDSDDEDDDIIEGEFIPAARRTVKTRKKKP
jgi:hypothetical protein